MANKKRSLGGFSRETPSLGERIQILTELDTMHDRSAAIICAAHLESNLETAIANNLIPLSKEEYDTIFVLDGAPLSSFAGKIRMAYALGIIGRQTKADLEAIKAVRNAFAHARRPITFSTQEITSTCSTIQFLSGVSRPDEPGFTPDEPWPPKEPRKIYCNATSFMAVALMTYAVEGTDAHPSPQGDDWISLIAK